MMKFCWGSRLVLMDWAAKKPNLGALRLGSVTTVLPLMEPIEPEPVEVGAPEALGNNKLS